MSKFSLFCIIILVKKMERLQKIIASSGYCSRRTAEKLIIAGKVKVNGVTITDLGTKASLSDTILVNGKIIKQSNLEYVLLYKPRGVISTVKDEKGRKTVVDLIETNNRLYPVGRLDYDTSGLILLTNDGALTNKLMHPSSEIDKVYVAKINEAVVPSKIKSLENGVMIDRIKTAKAKTKILKIDKKNNTSLVKITIHEGRNHQVKKMFEAIGYKVIKLKREELAFLNLNGLKAGEYRHLTIKEVRKLYNICQ